MNRMKIRSLINIKTYAHINKLYYYITNYIITGKKIIRDCSQERLMKKCTKFNIKNSKQLYQSCYISCESDNCNNGVDFSEVLSKSNNIVLCKFMFIINVILYIYFYK